MHSGKRARSDCMPEREVTLVQVLQAREDRVRLQQQLLETYRCPLVSFTMNIAGPIKSTPLIQRGFQEGRKYLEQHLVEGSVRKLCADISITGCQALYAVNMDAAELKRICIAIEDSTPLGRLFDMDVLDIGGTKLERTATRGCIVCGAPGRACAAARTHTVPQLQAATNRILREHFLYSDSKQIAAAAVQSLLDEVFTTPKPGLVDRRNSGSHTDMDMELFIASAHSLQPYFEECFKIGQSTAMLPPQDTFSFLRRAGIAAEETMYRTNGGVNTHKGAIYTLGILCCSLGRLWSAEIPIPKLPAILSVCSKLAQDAAASDFSSNDSSTAGLWLYRQYGLRGIRGEVAAGLPSVSKISLPAYKEGLSKGLSPNDAGALALLHLIAHVEDTNLYRRGGCEGAAWAADAARMLLENNPSVKQIEALDDAFIAWNLSPGGCADLLAVTYFLDHIQSLCMV